MNASLPVTGNALQDLRLATRQLQSHLEDILSVVPVHVTPSWQQSNARRSLPNALWIPPLPYREISQTALMYYSCKNGARGACHGDSILDPAGYRDAGRQPSQSSSARHLDNESGLQCTIRMRQAVNLLFCVKLLDKFEFIGLISLHHAEPGHLY